MADVSNGEIALYVAAGMYAVKEFLVPLVKGSFMRNIQAKDEHEKKTDSKLEEHVKEIATMKVALASFSSTLAAELGSINGRLTALDTRVEKQGQAHDARLKEGLADVGTEFNRKLAATLNVELERTVREVVREELKRWRGRDSEPP